MPPENSEFAVHCRYGRTAPRNRFPTESISLHLCTPTEARDARVRGLQLPRVVCLVGIQLQPDARPRKNTQCCDENQRHAYIPHLRHVNKSLSTTSIHHPSAPLREVSHWTILVLLVGVFRLPSRYFVKRTTPRSDMEGSPMLFALSVRRVGQAGNALSRPLTAR